MVGSNYMDPTIGAHWITTGPDGALWFANHGNNSIGRISTTGVVSNYTGAGISSGPTAITVGPDGALWFTDTDSIGRITTAGVIASYQIRASSTPTASPPDLMARSGSP